MQAVLPHLGYLVFLAQLSQSLSSGVGLIEGIGVLGGTGLLIVAAIQAKQDRGLVSLWTAIIAAIVMGTAFYIVQASFKGGGSASAAQVIQGNLQ